MRVSQSWKRNTPSTACGESITITIQCYSFDKEEIDKLEEELPKGLIFFDVPKQSDAS